MELDDSVLGSTTFRVLLAKAVVHSRSGEGGGGGGGIMNGDESAAFWHADWGGRGILQELLMSYCIKHFTGDCEGCLAGSDGVRGCVLQTLPESLYNAGAGNGCFVPMCGTLFHLGCDSSSPEALFLYISRVLPQKGGDLHTAGNTFPEKMP